MAAEAAISSAVELLGDLLIQKVQSLRSVEGQVESLKEELRRMQCFLEDANRKHVEDAGVRNWMSEIREVALDAEDTIQMFLLNIEKANKRGSIKRCTNFPKRMHLLDKIGGEIESIWTRLKKIDESRERYGIRIPDVASGSTSRLQVESRRRLPPWGKDEHLVGIENEVKKLLRESILDEEKKGLSAAVLKGMGGIGKSTLAREIYNHPDVVAGPFACRAWVVVSSEFRVVETMKQLILELPGADKKELRALEKSTNDEHYLLRKFQEMLHQLLQAKTYLIVLDDVWEKQHWEYLMSVFPNEKDKTSRLLVTTRNKIITNNDQYEHEMKALDSEKSWELLLKKANINGKCPKELEIIGRQIVEKCCGLPLAISVVGGLLMGTRTKSGWERFLNQINSYLGGEKSDVSPILELSYQNLSPQLKPCFLCLAFFKEDYIIPAQRLVDIWVAQGLIQQEGSSTIDDIGRGYLNELINRSMLQIEDLTVDDRVEDCRLHDLLRDLCLRKAKEEMGLKIASVVSSEESSYKTRQLVVHDNNLKNFSLKQNNHLRSLFLLSARGVYDHVRIPSHYWKSFELLKTLDLDNVELRRLPRSFRLLVGLKYMRIVENPGYLKLPRWFDHLKKLEVLEVENVRFPSSTLEMESLRHFRAKFIYHGVIRIKNWENIETLNGIRLDDFLEICSTMTASSHLRELCIFVTHIPKGDNVVSRAKACLKQMTNLVELQLSFSPIFSNLTQFILDASVFPPNLPHLKFGGELDDTLMEEFGKLQKLEYLTLMFIKVRRIKVLHDGFPCLKALSLKGMDDLRLLDIEEGGMPCLQRLQIRRCPHLKTHNLPKHINILAA